MIMAIPLLPRRLFKNPDDVSQVLVYHRTRVLGLRSVAGVKG